MVIWQHKKIKKIKTEKLKKAFPCVEKPMCRRGSQCVLA